MDSMPQYPIMEHYDQFRRFIAFLEANFEFIPGVAYSRNMTTLEAKLHTIHNAMQADSQCHQLAKNENARLRALNDNVTNEYNKAYHEKNTARAENERLLSINARLFGSNRHLRVAKSRLHTNNEQLKAELRMLKKHSSPHPSGRSTYKENIQPRVQAEDMGSDRSLQEQLEAARCSRALDHHYITIVKRDNRALTTKLQASVIQAKGLSEELERTKSRLIEKLLSSKGSDPKRLSEMWTWFQEDIEKVQALAAEKQKEIETVSMELKQCNLRLRKAQVKIGKKNEELNRMEERLRCMGRSDRRHESQTVQAEKQRKGHDHESQNRGVCSDRCQWNKENIKVLQNKIQELENHLDDMASVLLDSEQQVKKMTDNKMQLAQGTARAKDQFQQSIVTAKELDQDRLHQIEALTETLVQMEMSAAVSKRRDDENESRIKDLEARLKDVESNLE
ncbi:hypothetical protein BGZ93_006095 [Podila epicladia]|nr:hypothetical protein BGZ92_004278 [Podila epicladia]KAG0095278.1 hypothetical protein BGZ93_006095 [Podila epicladia]